MATWYAQEVYTPDDATVDRRRKYSEFQFTERPSVTELAVAGMVAVGWNRESAERAVKDEADLDGTDIVDGMLSFVIFGHNGEHEITIQNEPFKKSSTGSVYVVMVNARPVAIRGSQLTSDDLQRLSTKHRLPVASFSVVLVEDVDG